ncbi:ammonium transporter [Pelagibacteraceae bacterium]|nr:ammonium transporter [Pelagibacteraceae bacterium]MDC0412936.1 ammonium transporter [Pelagibacteraceae bacterium]
MKIKNLLLVAIFSLLFVNPSFAAESTVNGETQFVFNTLLFLICGFLVMFMAPGFAMLECGLVTSKSVSSIAAKNIGLYSIAGIMFWLCGYNVAYGISEGGFIGNFSSWSDGTDFKKDSYAAGSDWWFQMVFAATTASIVSGTLAERIKIWPFFLFVAILTGVLYPIEMGWQWGGGWLAAKGFSDFAGSTLVHAAGGAAALAGAIILGPRVGRFTSGKNLLPFAASSIPLATLGTFVLWFGWFGFNGGSQLALGTFADASAISTIFINTNLAAAAGVMVNALITRFVGGKTDVVMMLNGALGGLVAITAEPLAPSPIAAICIGGIGAAVVVAGTSLLEKLKIDDVVGAIPVHLFAGIWGTLAVPITNKDMSFATQFLGTFSVVAFMFIASIIVWSILKATIGIRISDEAQKKGTDVSEIGVRAYAIRD